MLRLQILPDLKYSLLYLHILPNKVHGRGLNGSGRVEMSNADTFAVLLPGDLLTTAGSESHSIFSFCIGKWMVHAY